MARDGGASSVIAGSSTSLSSVQVMNRIAHTLLVAVGLTVGAAYGIGAVAGPAAAAPLGTTMPPNCVANTGLNAGDADLAGDYRCAGLAVRFHTGGVAMTDRRQWAGQWLFVDAEGRFRVGSCTYNLGIHPSVLGPAVPVAQAFPNDPSGAKVAYLAWRYGDTTDNPTAAAMWAVMHYYAQDAAGSFLSVDRDAPLIASLERIAALTGEPALQARAIELDQQAALLGGTWTLTLEAAPNEAGATASVALAAAAGGVPGVDVAVTAGDGATVTLTTDATGRATAAIALPPGTTTVSATAAAPGPASVFRGPPASPNPMGAQTLVTAGEPLELRAEAVVDVPQPTSTTTTAIEATTTSTIAATTSTTDAPTTTAAPTTAVATTTEGATTTEVSTTTEVPTTTITTAEVTTTSGVTPTSVAPTTSAAPTTTPGTTVGPVASSPPQLPRTGNASNQPAYLGTAFLVGGIGLLGTVRRRAGREPPPDDFDFTR